MTIRVITQWGLIWVRSQIKIGVGAEARAVEQLEIWLTQNWFPFQKWWKWELLKRHGKIFVRHKMKIKWKPPHKWRVNPVSIIQHNHHYCPKQLRAKTGWCISSKRCITQLAYEKSCGFEQAQSDLCVLCFCVWKWSVKAKIPKNHPTN